ncbi:MAG: hypothetical protein HY289_07645 [Planctomycetes bacterium]|nr:hypothetical protein [Planctomycetota bacterium]
MKSRYRTPSQTAVTRIKEKLDALEKTSLHGDGARVFDEHGLLSNVGALVPRSAASLSTGVALSAVPASVSAGVRADAGLFIAERRAGSAVDGLAARLSVIMSTQRKQVQHLLALRARFDSGHFLMIAST